MTRHHRSLFIFRRDLRITDNNGLNQALQLSQQVLPCFIFDPRQIKAHPYQSQPALAFMLQSLADLRQQLKDNGGELALYQGQPEQVISKLHSEQCIDAVFINRDYTPFSRHRDADIADTCQALGITLHYLADALLNEPEQVLKNGQTRSLHNGQTPYQVFTPFYKNAARLPVTLPKPLAGKHFLAVGDTGIQLEAFTAPYNQSCIMGGRSTALRILDDLSGYHDYQSKRDFPALPGTSKLSAHLKFGTCSVREVYHAISQQLGDGHPLLRQLYWRDFFTHIAYHYPQVFGAPFQKQYANLPWDNNLDNFQKWCEGKTGFPLVDAGMRELNASGFMHNRVRMVVASFLVKDLHISWWWGERYFAQKLVDYDPCVNNGNWQWAASTGCDAQPYFRIFNPWLQQKKFDPECRYICHWLPELQGLPPKTVHQWHSLHFPCAYPPPMLDHATESALSKAVFKAAARPSIQTT